MCATPITITNTRTNEKQSVPCGRCELCLKRRVSGWSKRLYEEDKYSSSSYFITFTYDTDNVPILRSGYLSLCKRHLQLFFKKLRFAHSEYGKELGMDVDRIKYYVCGEYGGKGWRPHYHALVFNAIPQLMFDNTALKLLNYSDFDGKEPVICKQWQYGHVTVGKVSEASVGYTLKYMCKPKRIPLHRNDDRQPEFSLMSKGIGKQYLTDEMVAWHKADLLNRMYVNVGGGKKAAMPRYYKQKIYTDAERSEISGYQKGQIEKDTLVSILSYDGNSSYAREKTQAAKAAKTRQEYSAGKRQKLL